MVALPRPQQFDRARNQPLDPRNPGRAAARRIASAADAITAPLRRQWDRRCTHALARDGQ
jgi:hypothetical protein